MENLLSFISLFCEGVLNYIRPISFKERKQKHRKKTNAWMAQKSRFESQMSFFSSLGTLCKDMQISLSNSSVGKSKHLRPFLVV